MADNNWNDRLPDGKPTEWGDRMPDDNELAKYRKRLRPQILTILGTHLVFAFAYLVLVNVVSTMWASHAAEWSVTVVCATAFMAVIFSGGSNYGRLEKNLMNYGHLKPDRHRGLRAALMSQIPGLVFVLLAVVYLFVTGDKNGNYVLFYRFFYAPFVKVLQILDNIHPLLCFVPLIIVPALYNAGYTLGSKGVSLLDRLMYKPQPSDKTGGSKLK